MFMLFIFLPVEASCQTNKSFNLVSMATIVREIVLTHECILRHHSLDLSHSARYYWTIRTLTETLRNRRLLRPLAPLHCHCPPH